MTGRWLDTTPLKVLQRQMNWPLFGLFIVVVLSALGTTYVSHSNRQAFHQLQKELMNKNDLQVEWGQLLLQHSTLTAHGRIEAIAREQLGMEVPRRVQVVPQ